MMTYMAWLLIFIHIERSFPHVSLYSYIHLKIIISMHSTFNKIPLEYGSVKNHPIKFLESLQFDTHDIISIANSDMTIEHIPWKAIVLVVLLEFLIICLPVLGGSLSIRSFMNGSAPFVGLYIYSNFN